MTQPLDLAALKSRGAVGYGTSAKEALALIKEVERLREALGPFGALRERLVENIALATNIWPQTNLSTWFHGSDALFNGADILRASTALAAVDAALADGGEG